MNLLHINKLLFKLMNKYYHGLTKIHTMQIIAEIETAI